MDTQNRRVHDLNKIKASVSLSEELIEQAIQKMESDPVLYEEAIRQAVRELALVQSTLENSMFTS